MILITIFLFFLQLVASMASESNTIWPQPSDLVVLGESTPISLSADFRFVMAPGSKESDILIEGLIRFSKIVEQEFKSDFEASDPAISELQLEITDPSAKLAYEQYPSLLTNYSYLLSVKDGTAVARAESHFGLLYAMESFAQISHGGWLPGNHIEITDSPMYNWRGIMLDAGRRFFPVPTVKNILDTMSAVKLNVLHLHASDQCRWGVQSMKFPELTANLTGDRAGFYTQADIADLMDYAAHRGIRVVPEFDVPGHTRGLLPLEKYGVQFCHADEKTSKNQLYNDPDGKTVSVIKELLSEMSALFKDEVFHIGCDETHVVDQCTLESTFKFERTLFEFTSNNLGRTPVGWEEAAFIAHATTPKTIVNSWVNFLAADVIKKGYLAIENHNKNFYMTQAVQGGPDGWFNQWYDISTNVSAANISMLLGGEISMWTDTYCYSNQCGAYEGKTPVGAALFPPDTDEAFAKSVTGMMWPRGFVGAGAFWNFNASVDPRGEDFVSAIWALNDKIAARGGLVCPTQCSCSQLEACGKPYLNSSVEHQ